MFLAQPDFSAAVNALPLISIDICLINSNKQLLLGKRNNPPAQGWWFTPGGRIRKNEPWTQALTRIAEDELGIRNVSEKSCSLIGIWDHFYENSAFSSSVSTHYVNLPHVLLLTPDMEKTLVLPQGQDTQHSLIKWWDLTDAAESDEIHEYVKPYIHWIKENLI